VPLLLVSRFAVAQDDDPRFDSTITNPAYRTEHPTIMLDRGHFNLRTPVGRNVDKTFGALFENDGYNVAYNEGRFRQDVLRGVQVLVIAAAGGGSDYAQASKPAFATEEIDVLESWIRGGGSLFLLFDHFPIAAAAEALAKRLGAQVELGLASDRAHDVSPPDCGPCQAQRGWIRVHAHQRAA
jgi:hypothetical protein